MAADAYIVIGNGWVVRTAYLPALALDGARVVAVLDIARPADLDRAIAQAASLLARHPGARVIVATPNDSHWRIATSLAPLARSVLVEKPMALPGEVTAAAARRFANISVSTPNRFRPDVARLKQLVAAGAVGAVRQVRIGWHRRSGVPRPGSWYTHAAAAGGGALADLGPHVLDLGLDLLGYPQCAVAAAETGRWLPPCADVAGRADRLSGGALPFDVETEARLTLASADGASHVFAVAWAAPVDSDRTIVEVVGSRASLRLETLFGFAPGPKVARLHGVVDETMPLVRDPAIDFARLLERERAGEAATARQGAAVMDVIAASYRRAGRAGVSA